MVRKRRRWQPATPARRMRRATRFREDVAWVKTGFRHWMGTHVACYDLVERRCLVQIDTEQAGIDAVFGVFAAR